MLALAAARGGEHATSFVVEDPPTLTFRFGIERAEAVASNSKPMFVGEVR